MGCISASIREEGNHLHATCNLIPSSLEVGIKSISIALKGKCTLIKAFLIADLRVENPVLKVVNQIYNTPIKASCDLICSVNGNYFLYVEPDVVWITEGMLSGEFEIVSNVSWKIE